METRSATHRRLPLARRVLLGCAALCGMVLLMFATPGPARAGSHWPLTVTLVQNLSFLPVVQGATATYVVAALDPTAAIFDAAGQKNAFVTATIVEATVTMATGGGGTPQTEIPVTAWTFGGSLTDLGGSGEARIIGTGVISNMRVGASANVSFDDVPGSYVGTGTFRLVYK